jgi:hypothetical protein
VYHLCPVAKRRMRRHVAVHIGAHFVTLLHIILRWLLDLLITAAMFPKLPAF